MRLKLSEIHFSVFQECMLKNLESKVREQDAYWTKVCLMKDNEIEDLKTVTEKSWAGR